MQFPEGEGERHPRSWLLQASVTHRHNYSCAFHENNRISVCDCLGTAQQCESPFPSSLPTTKRCCWYLHNPSTKSPSISIYRIHISFPFLKGIQAERNSVKGREESQLILQQLTEKEREGKLE